MNILWIKSGGLLPLDAGGKIRSFHIAQELARRHDVTLFTFYPAEVPDPNLPLGEPFRHVERHSIKVAERGSVSDVFKYAANVMTSRPYQMRKYCRPEILERVRDMLRHKRYEVILCDYLLTAGVLPWDTGTPVVIFTHNAETVVWRRQFLVNENPLWKLAAWREQKTIARAERQFTSRADHVLTVSDVDRQFFLEFLPEERVTTVPTGVDLQYFRPREGHEELALVFTGSMDWTPNEDAVVYFSREVLPLIHQRLPKVTLTVVGKNPTRKLVLLAQQNPAVRVTGTVQDVRPYIADAPVYIVPLRIGSGTRIKIFEAMAMGKAVVSTTVGAEGLPVQDGKNIILADSASDFADRTVELLTKRQRRDEIGSAARALVESHYSWTTATDVVERVLCAAVNQKGVH